MPFRRRLDLLLLTVAVVLTRFVFRSHYLYDVDSVNFALGMRRFNPQTYQPHPPGYFLYVCAGRLLNAVLHNANLALVVLSIVASCGALIMIYQLTYDWFDKGTARMAALLFLFSPLAWFHGTVALTYSVEAFFSALLGWLCWRVSEGEMRLAVPTGLLLGISAGVRPSSLLLLGPLYLFALFHADWRRRFGGLAAVVSTILAWFVPMVVASGGPRVYFGALFSLWRLVPSKDTVFNSSPATSIARAFTIFLIYLLCFGAASIVPLASPAGQHVMDRRKKMFLAVWCLPPLCFFTFIFLKFVNSGYLLIVAPPACIWMGHRMAEWYEGKGWSKGLKRTLIVMGAAANVAIFLVSPFYCSFRSVRRFEAELASIRTALPQVASSQHALIIGFDSHFLGYRHAGYYLPDYLTLQYPAVELIQGPRAFSMHGRDTRLLSTIQASGYSTFILFPLPQGNASYRDYLNTVKRKLPDGSLRIVHAGGHDFVTGSISDLSRLFPGM